MIRSLASTDNRGPAHTEPAVSSPGLQACRLGSRLKTGAASLEIAVKDTPLLLSRGMTPQEVADQLASETGCSPKEISRAVASLPKADLELCAEILQPTISPERYPPGLQSLFGTATAHVKTHIVHCRAEALRTITKKCWVDETFSDPARYHEILAPMPETQAARRPPQPADLPAYFRELYQQPVLTREQEYHLFRKYNFLKYSIQNELASSDGSRLSWNDLRNANKALGLAEETRNIILQRNLRLVVSIARRYSDSGEERFFAAVSTGNMGLLTALDAFDFTRGNKFSTYATCAVRSALIREYTKRMKYEQRYRGVDTEHPFLAQATAPEDPATPDLASASPETVTPLIKLLFSRLDDRQKEILTRRFGIGCRKETLKEVGERIGISKERVRQLEQEASDIVRITSILARTGFEMVGSGLRVEQTPAPLKSDLREAMIETGFQILKLLPAEKKGLSGARTPVRRGKRRDKTLGEIKALLPRDLEQYIPTALDLLERDAIIMRITSGSLPVFRKTNKR